MEQLGNAAKPNDYKLGERNLPPPIQESEMPENSELES